MKILATGTNNEIKALMRALKADMSIESYELDMADGRMLATIEAGKCITNAAAAELLGVTPQRVAQLKRAGTLASDEEGILMSAVEARIANPPAAHRPTAATQSFRVYRLGRNKSGRGEFIAEACDFEAVKQYAEEYDGVYAIGLMDGIEFVQPSA